MDTTPLKSKESLKQQISKYNEVISKAKPNTKMGNKSNIFENITNVYLPGSKKSKIDNRIIDEKWFLKMKSNNNYLNRQRQKVPTTP